ncbi:unnamed protein product [Effrenium voratum]|nr:unnamed protein product [Effrenium voratum]
MALARRRRDAALASLAALDAEAKGMQGKTVFNMPSGRKELKLVPLVSAAGLLLLAQLKAMGGGLGLPWLLVTAGHSQATQLPEPSGRPPALRAVAASWLRETRAVRWKRASGMGPTSLTLDLGVSNSATLGDVKFQAATLSADLRDVMLDLCQILAVALRGRRDFTLDLDEAWGVVQKKGDYFPMEARRASSQDGFGCIMDLDLPPSLSIDNHERPTKGSYGFHDGLHNLLWKGDRTTDKDDLVQPGIIQLELRVGQLYVFPDWVQTITYPFEGPGQRRWIAATVALSLGLKARQRILAKVLRESAWMASEGEEWQPRDPPFPSEALRSQRRWEKKRHSLGGSQPPWPDLWQADDVSLDWLRGFLAKYRTVEMVATRSAGRESSRRTRVIDVLLDDAKSGEDCLQSFISRLRPSADAGDRMPV